MSDENLPTPALQQHYLFLKYTLAVKEFLQNNIYLGTSSPLTVYFAPLERAYAKQVVPMYNGLTIKPLISFNINDFSINQQGSVMNGYAYQHIYLEDEDVFARVNPPVICDLNYSVNLWVNLRKEADIALYQLITAAPKNRKYPVKVDNQWAEIFVDSFQDQTNLEPQDVQDRVVRYTFTLNINRAYLPQQSLEMIYRINEIELAYDIQ